MEEEFTQPQLQVEVVFTQPQSQVFVREVLQSQPQSQPEFTLLNTFEEKSLILVPPYIFYTLQYVRWLVFVSYILKINSNNNIL